MLGRCCLGERNWDFPSPPHLSHAGNVTSDNENKLGNLDDYEPKNVENYIIESTFNPCSQ